MKEIFNNTFRYLYTQNRSVLGQDLMDHHFKCLLCKQQINIYIPVSVAAKMTEIQLEKKLKETLDMHLSSIHPDKANAFLVPSFNPTPRQNF